MKIQFKAWLLTITLAGMVTVPALAANGLQQGVGSTLFRATLADVANNMMTTKNQTIAVGRYLEGVFDVKSINVSEQRVYAQDNTFTTTDRPRTSRDNEYRHHDYRGDRDKHRYHSGRGNDQAWRYGGGYTRYEGHGVLYESITYPYYGDRYSGDRHGRENNRHHLDNRSRENLPRRHYPNRG